MGERAEGNAKWGKERGLLFIFDAGEKANSCNGIKSHSYFS